MPLKPSFARPDPGYPMKMRNAACMTFATALTAVLAAAVICYAPPAQSAPPAFVLNRGLGDALLGKASLIATAGR